VNQDLIISGFSDEISSDFDTQLEVVSKLGMHYISLRGIDGKNIGDFSVEDVKENVLPRLQKWNVGVSSIGSPIGKVFGYKLQYESLLKILENIKSGENA